MNRVGVLQHTSITSHTLPTQACGVEKGCFSNDGRVVWLWSREGGVTVYGTPQLSKIGWLDTEGLSLVSSCELRYRGITLFVLVLVDHSQSIIAVLSQSSGQLIQAVQISGPPIVSCVCGVNDTILPGLFATSTLLHFSGVVCLGCQNACVIVLDLGLGNLEDCPKSSISAPRPCMRVHVSTSSIVTQLNLAADKEAQLGLELNSQYIKRNVFHYADSAEKLIASFDEASVSSLLHVPQLCSILIGYSFGGFQIFSFLENFILFSYPLSIKRLPPPITHFTFQEPENDPKPFVYIWVARNGLPQQGRLGSSPSLTLYQFTFKRKLDVQGSTYYQDMEGCIQRFEHLLWPHPYSSAVMLKCYTIERLLHVGDADSSFSNSKAPSKSLSVDRTLSVFMCQVVEDDVIEERDTRGLMVVFDLNQWYHCQMPIFANWSSTESQTRKRCPFLAVYKLSSNNRLLLDARISSVSPFHGPPPVPETHLWPESLTINLDSLTASDVNICLYEGVQQLVLNQLISFGADMMIDPERFMSMCLEVDLLESPPGGDPQQYLLSVCLLYLLRSTLMALVKAVQNPGCRLSLGSLVEWIKTMVNELTTEKPKIFETLGSSSATGVVDQFTLKRVLESHHQLALLTDLIVELYSDHHPLSLSEDELTEMYNPASVYSEIFQTAHWCMENGLLPHSLDTDHTPMSENSFVFPIAALQERYTELEDRRTLTGLAIDVLIGQLADEESPFKYPPDGIDCLMYSKIYPATVTRYCLDLYVLCDVSPSPDDTTLIESYCKRFEITNEIMKLSHSVWMADHGTPSTDDAKLLSVYFPTVFELAIKSLIDNGQCNEAIQSLTVSRVSCPRLHLQALAYSGHVQKAYTLLTNYEGSEEYELLLEHFVEHCLTSNHAYKLKQLQLNAEQLNVLCKALKAQGGDEAIHLSLSLLLLHQCNIEAITLAREKGRQGGVLGKCLAYGSTLLPPVKEGMCSEELLRRIRSTADVPIGPPQSLSAVMPKSNEQNFTSQLDIILAVSKKVAEARNAVNDPVTPLRKHKRLDDTISASPGLPTIPFTSSPLPSSQRTRTLRQTPLVHSTWRTPVTPRFVPTPGKADRAMGQFLAQMEGFRVRMAKMSGMPKIERDLNIRTPQVIRLEKSPYHLASTLNHPASILKTIPSFRPSPSEEYLATTSRKIRFAIDDSLEVTPGKKSLAIDTPLPESDDSEHFYSPQGSLKPHDTITDGSERRPDVDELGANVVIATEGNGVKGSGSFVASAEDEENEQQQPRSSSELSKIVLSPSEVSKRLESTKRSPDDDDKDTNSRTVSTKLARSSLTQKSSDKATPSKFHSTVKISPKLVVSPLTFAPTTHPQRDSLTSSVKKRSYHTTSSWKKFSKPQQEFKKYSGVMVNIEDTKYTFSPPQTVAMVTPSKDQEPSHSVGSEYVFSPPLLRSANRDRKKAELRKTGIDEKSPSSLGDTPITSVVTPRLPLHKEQQKRVRQVKTAQSTPRRSERLLRATKK